MFDGLPEKSYTLKPESTEVVLVRRGESGHNPTKLSGDKAFVRELNKKLGVTPAQSQAMFIGSMFGWDVPGANPAAYKCGSK